MFYNFAVCEQQELILYYAYTNEVKRIKMKTSKCSFQDNIFTSICTHSGLSICDKKRFSCQTAAQITTASSIEKYAAASLNCQQMWTTIYVCI